MGQVSKQRIRILLDAPRRRSAFSLFIAFVITFAAMNWWSEPAVESASSPVETCGIGIAPCFGRPLASPTARSALQVAATTRFRNVIPVSARGVDLTGSHFERISVIIPASGGSVTASDQSFTLTVPAGTALDPAGNQRNVKLFVEQITPPEDNQMVVCLIVLNGPD